MTGSRQRCLKEIHGLSGPWRFTDHQRGAPRTACGIRHSDRCEFKAFVNGNLGRMSRRARPDRRRAPGGPEGKRPVPSGASKTVDHERASRSPRPLPVVVVPLLHRLTTGAPRLFGAFGAVRMQRLLLHIAEGMSPENTRVLDRCAISRACASG